MSAESFKLLDVALGLIFIYASLSIIVTAAMEVISAVTRLRAKVLREGILWLLDGETFVKPYSFADDILKHKLIHSQAKGENDPSYIPPRTFALVLIDILRSRASTMQKIAMKDLDPAKFLLLVKDIPDKFLPKHLREQLLLIAEHAQSAGRDIETAIELWYEQTMDRVSGWFKRRVKLITLFVGLLIAVAVNADTIRIVQALWTDEALRIGFTVAAEQAAENSSNIPGCPDTGDLTTEDFAACVKQQVQVTRDAYRQLGGLPLGWTPGVDGSPLPDGYGPFLPWTTPIGWLITAVALSMGTPFWFGLLQRLASLRSAGERPETSPAGQRTPGSVDGKPKDQEA